MSTVEPRAGRDRVRIWHWVHLVYLVFLFAQPGFDPASGALDWVLASVVAALAVAVYVAATLADTARVRWVGALPMAALATLAAPLNASATVLFIYSAAFAGSCETRRFALRWFATLSLLTVALAFVSQTPMPYRLWSVLPPLLLIWVVGFSVIAEADKDRESAELRLRNARIEHLATVSERERIARDLHDLLGHSLTAVVVRAQLLRELVAGDPARAAEEAAEIERTAREALSEVRSAVTGWRRASLDAELEAGRGTLRSVGVELDVEREPGLTLVGSTEHELAGALREALTNVARHADARTCRVALTRRDGELRLTVADDGIGLRARGREGNGIAGMRDRVAVLGGTIRLQGERGTTVTIAVPLEVAV
ncbi:two-component sensor histidine kinase [Amycolatopsis antarctica]|uniref:Two-component sensor histidine kinase n=1 Tax=Amycolatopsis antarctica TaxID=1854586 RepID=A0A263CXJ8_9PSEU|nr:sensor histidine kinase [Amycolatopsis antarctica]OZM70147.1 two-component sensor histidine kinase [Amycolatopsis antarctica]